MKKKLKLLLLGLALTTGGFSCSESEKDLGENSETDPVTEHQPEKAEVLTAEFASEEFCRCSEKEGDEKQICYDAWISKYKDLKAEPEDAKKMGETMAVCAPIDAMEVLLKFAN